MTRLATLPTPGSGAGFARVSTFALRRGPAIVTILLVVLLAWLLSHWVWLLAGPQPVATTAAQISSASPAQATERIAAAHLFGIAGTSQAETTSQRSSLNVRLKGVFAATTERQAYAIINVGDTRDDAFHSGDTVVPGAKLDAVRPDPVLIRHAGALDRIDHERRPRSGAGGSAVPTIARAMRTAT